MKREQGADLTTGPGVTTPGPACCGRFQYEVADRERRLIPHHSQRRRKVDGQAGAGLLRQCPINGGWVSVGCLTCLRSRWLSSE